LGESKLNSRKATDRYLKARYQVLRLARHFWYSRMLNWFRRPKTWFLPRCRVVNSTDYSRFIVIGMARSGTTYLQTLLSSHDQVVSYGEVFHLLAKRRVDLFEITRNPTEYVNREIYKPHPEHIKAVGYKMVYTEMGSGNIFLREMETRDVAANTKERRERFSLFMQTNFDLVKVRQRFADHLTYLENDPNIKVIHVRRRNRLEILLSTKLASRSGVWRSTSGSYLRGPIHLDFEECLRFFEETDTLENRYASLFRDHRVIQVFYEEMIGDTSSSLEEVQSFLGVEHKLLSSPLRKQNKLRAPDAISNYFELREEFRDTKWIGYFEE
jgi:LPS sulfotransferase NodH